MNEPHHISKFLLIASILIYPFSFIVFLSTDHIHVGLSSTIWKHLCDFHVIDFFPQITHWIAHHRKDVNEVCVYNPTKTPAFITYQADHLHPPGGWAFPSTTNQRNHRPVRVRVGHLTTQRWIRWSSLVRPVRWRDGIFWWFLPGSFWGRTRWSFG